MCHNCEAGRFANWTKEDTACKSCPIGRSTNGLTGKAGCPSCKNNNDLFVGGNFYFQDKIGQEYCRLCKNSDTPGGRDCDHETGNLRVGDCDGLYTLESKCNDREEILQSILIAYGVFAFEVLLFVPFIFRSGGLAVLARVWRKDVGAMADWMQDTTSRCYRRRMSNLEEIESRRRELFLLAAFKRLRHLQGVSAPLVVVDQHFQRLMQDSLGVGPAFVSTLLERMLQVDPDLGSADDSAPYLTLSKAQFRRFVSLTTRRLLFARQQAKYRAIFNAFDDDGSQSIDKEELDELSSTMGFDFTPRDLEILKGCSDPATEEIYCEGFTAGIYMITMEKKVKRFLGFRRERDQALRSAFDRRATETAGGFGEPKLTRVALNDVLAELGLPLSMTVIRKVTHAARQSIYREYEKDPLEPYHKLLARLEGGAWFWLVVLPVVLAVLYLFFYEGRDGLYEMIPVLVIQAEVLLRLAVYLRVGRTPTQFVQRNPSNGLDFMDALVDIAYFVGRICLGDEFFLKFGIEIKSVHLVRLIRLLPVARKVLPLDSIALSICKLCKVGSERDGHVSYPVFRRCVSSLQQHMKRLDVAWPTPICWSAFSAFDRDSGAVQAKDLEPLLKQAGLFALTPYELMQIERIVRRPGDDAFIYFEDFCDVLSFVNDEAGEADLLNQFETHEDRARKTLMYTLSSAVQVLINTSLQFATEIAAFATNIYVLAASRENDIEALKIKLYTYADACRESMDTFPIFFQNGANAGAYVLSNCFEGLLRFGSYLEFDFQNVAKGGVSCTGVQSLVYLPMIYLIAAIIIVLFDSTIYSFLKVAPTDYEHLTAVTFHGSLPATELARVAEHFSVKAASTGASSLLKTLIQIIIANMTFAKFVPYWRDVTPVCESPKGGYPYSETFAQYMSTFLFYAMLPVMGHLLLNTFVYGLAPASQDSAAPEEDYRRKRMSFLPKAQKRTSTFRREEVVTSYKEVNGADDSFILYNRTFSVRACSPLRLLFPRWSAHRREHGDEPEVVILHNPGFWHVPEHWWCYFKDQCDGNFKRSCRLYLKTMRWKMKLLLKLTVGWWDDELLNTQQIKFRSDRFDLNDDDPFEKHEAMMIGVGQSHSLVWLFFPYLSIISKLGEALNSSHVFVFDDVVPDAISSASNRLDEFERIRHSPPEEEELEQSDDSNVAAAGMVSKKEEERIPEPTPAAMSPKYEATAVVSPKQENRLPDGWERKESRSEPGTYVFVHLETGVRTDRQPTESTQQASIEFCLSQRQNQASSNRSQVNRRSERPLLARRTNEELPRNGLPDGWERRQSRSKPGTHVFVHRESGARTRSQPTESTQQALIESWISQNNYQNQASSSRSLARMASRRSEQPLRAPITDEEEEYGDSLPDGWIKRESRSKPGTHVFMHLETGARTNLQPTIDTQAVAIETWLSHRYNQPSSNKSHANRRSKQSSQVPTINEVGANDRLPEGWKMESTEHGVRYVHTSGRKVATKPTDRTIKKLLMKDHREKMAKLQQENTTGGAPSQAEYDASDDNSDSSYSSDFHSDDSEATEATRDSKELASRAAPVEVHVLATPKQPAALDDEEDEDEEEDEEEEEEDEAEEEATLYDEEDNDDDDNDNDSDDNHDDDPERPATPASVDEPSEIPPSVDNVVASMPSNFRCPISAAIMVEPVILEQSGQTYDRKHLTACLESRPGKDPMTNTDFEGPARIIPNFGLKGAITEWLEYHSIDRKLFETPPKDSIVGALHIVNDENALDDRVVRFHDTSTVRSQSAAGGGGGGGGGGGSGGGDDDESEESSEESVQAKKKSPGLLARFFPKPEQQPDLGIWSFSVEIEYDDKDMETTKYYELKIQRPQHAPKHKKEGEGMLIWFENGSVIGERREIAKALNQSLAADLPRVTFFEFDDDESPEFGTKFVAEKGKVLFEDELAPPKMHGKLRKLHLGDHGRTGKGLYSRAHPLYVPDSKCCCVMAVRCPRGFTPPSFTVSACWVGETPLQLARERSTRTFLLTCNVTLFACLIIVVNNMYGLASRAFFISLAVALMKSFFETCYRSYWRGFFRGYNFSDMFYGKAFREFLETMQLEFWAVSFQYLTRAKNSSKVQPVVLGATTKHLPVAKAADDSAAAGSAAGDDSGDDGNDSWSSGHSESDGWSSGELGEGSAKAPKTKEPKEKKMPKAKKAKAPEVKAPKKPTPLPRLELDDDIGERVEPGLSMDGLDPLLASRVHNVLRKSPRQMRKRRIAAKQLSQACHPPGLVGADSCFRVISLYAEKDIDMRFRSEEIALHLSRLCTMVRKKIIELDELDDIFFGPCSEKFSASSEGAPGQQQRRASWHSGDGFDLYRHVLLDEVETDRRYKYVEGDSWQRQPTLFENILINLRTAGGAY